VLHHRESVGLFPAVYASWLPKAEEALARSQVDQAPRYKKRELL